jgi:hypothetical protein
MYSQKSLYQENTLDKTEQKSLVSHHLHHENAKFVNIPSGGIAHYPFFSFILQET